MVDEGCRAFHITEAAIVSGFDEESTSNQLLMLFQSFTSDPLRGRPLYRSQSYPSIDTNYCLSVIFSGKQSNGDDDAIIRIMVVN